MSRVNGNLNLSRAIGDLKYKGNDQLAPAEQIITAQPDIVKVCKSTTEQPMRQLSVALVLSAASHAACNPLDTYNSAHSGGCEWHLNG